MNNQLNETGNISLNNKDVVLDELGRVVIKDDSLLEAVTAAAGTGLVDINCVRGCHSRN